MLLMVAAVETLGADTLAHCRMAVGDKGSDFVLRVPGTVPIHVGQRLPVTLDRKAIHFFDVKTKNRMF
jgi:ABC-type sugar transport system ATPase subunit